MADFRRWKEQRLSRADGSRKGSVDEPIADIVRLLNDHDSFCTTSSCSGRVVVLEQPPVPAPAEPTTGFEIQKQNCTWLMVTHQICTMEEVLTALRRATDDAIFKFEPFVLHVQCQELQDAQLLHKVAIEAGFRNSGITVGRKGKIMMAVRSTHCLEVPLSQKGKLMVNEEYVDFVVQVANQKMEENRRRIDRFYSSLQFALENRDCFRSLLDKEREQNRTEQNNTMDTSCRSRRKSKGTQKDSEYTSVQKNRELGSEDDTESNLNFFPLKCAKNEFL
ncbi:tRNA wybutosine-synthesizing protein 3 homolog [Eublepharis macularius]|uniref:tRNA wybutosine-synthesizing protein 3 homolog n=1 Tax=Eublepharis macularius TaxID=481883 RepID=A0AA97KZ79_EUBMA|nr:tRNA wybutosine-synthesizing protein 3 homolog [Eublepharis macularius]